MLTMENKPNKIILHHTAGTQKGHQGLIVDEMHKKQGYKKSMLGRFGAYHFLIEKDGTIFSFRVDCELAYSTKSHNADTLQIALAGNFNLEQPTELQKKTLQTTLRTECQKYNIKPEDIRRHGDIENTECPGKRLNSDWIKRLMNEEI